MIFWKVVFWISCAIVFYNYAGYALIIFILSLFRKKQKQSVPNDFFPSISFIVAAYNEEECLERKIENSIHQNYPAEKIEFIFITDGSTDASADIVRRFPLVQLLHENERKGKSAALNRAVATARNEILIFSDANTILNEDACLHIAKHYFDESVGGVAGEKKVITIQNENQNAVNSEGFYWKYESLLKKLDSEFYSVVGAAGELFSARKKLYRTVPLEVILDDFIISMKIAQQGYRIIYEPRAYAMELPSFSMEEERKRKIRIAAGGFQAMTILPETLYFWRQPKLSFLYISHRLLRWTLSPLCLVMVLLSSFILTIMSTGTIYKMIFFTQALFYSTALLYHFFPFIGKKISVLRLAYYFSFMNLSVFHGFINFLRKKQPSTWEKAKRSSYSFGQVKND
jgi:cellulose synthase/poly-beta-1,6-N-acetylglucosamine synthase-like glycosyltransferase